MSKDKLRDLLVLTKPRITALVVVSGGAGYLIGTGSGTTSWGSLVVTLLGIGLVAGGTSALNQLLERRADARMERTRGRPLPAGRLTAVEAGVFASLVSVTGILLLGELVNLLTATLAMIALVGYAGIYTPLKRVTSLSTLVGAVPGALPVVGGWTAATGELGAGAWALFGIVFFWQLPHFLALAWLHRTDYRAAGFRMPGTGEEVGPRGRMQSALYALALFPASLLPVLVGLGGATYAAAALGLTSLYLAAAMRFTIRGDARGARSLFRASLVYLPLLMLFLTWDRPPIVDSGRVTSSSAVLEVGPLSGGPVP